MIHISLLFLKPGVFKKNMMYKVKESYIASITDNFNNLFSISEI